MNRLLRMNTGLLFCALTLPWLIRIIIPFYPYLTYMVVALLSYSVVFLWILFLDAELIKRVPLKIRPSNTLFLVNLILVYLLCCAIVIYLEPGKEFSITGLAAFPFLYLFYAWFSIYDHLSKLLLFAEEEKQITLRMRIGDMILFFFFFIGVWWLQPRIRNILKKSEVTRASYTFVSE